MDVLAEVKRIMSNISRIDVEELESDVKIREEVGVDSLMAMEIVATCEKRLDIHIDESELYNVETIGDFENLVVSLYSRKHGDPK
jgi:acyl carrier protein